MDCSECLAKSDKNSVNTSIIGKKVGLGGGTIYICIRSQSQHVCADFATLGARHEEVLRLRFSAEKAMDANSGMRQVVLVHSADGRRHNLYSPISPPRDPSGFDIAAA